MLEPVRPEVVLPDRALCLPTFSHFLIVNKLLSLPPFKYNAETYFVPASLSFHSFTLLVKSYPLGVASQDLSVDDEAAAEHVTAQQKAEEFLPVTCPCAR